MKFRLKTFLITLMLSLPVVAADIFNLSDTWNNGATTFNAIKMNVTDTASAADSKLLNLQVGSVEKFTVDKAGIVSVLSSLNTISANTTLFLQGRGFTVADDAIVIMAGNPVTNTSGTFKALTINPTYNQTGTAAATDLLINRTETAVGSGSQFLIDGQVGGVSLFDFDNVGQLTLDKAQTFGLTTGIAWGDGGAKIYETADNALVVSLSAGVVVNYGAGVLNMGSGSTGAGLAATVASSTTVNVFPRANDGNTGLGRAGDDQLSIIAGGIEGIRLSEASSHVLFDNELHAGLTAGTTQTQAGGLQLLSSFNEIATAANMDDTVVLPEAAVGRVVNVMNNGANRIQIFPAVSDDLGRGVDAAVQLMANNSVTYRAIGTVAWVPVASTQLLHGTMYDEANTDVFAISGQSNVTAYHTNGMTVGHSNAWTLDVGGNGTSFPIASIADSAGSPGTQILVTTTGSHGLAVNDVISQSNLTDAAYEGIFVVVATAAATTYEVAAVFTATGTGTMDQAASLVAGTGAVGMYELNWSASLTSSVNNDTFDYMFYKNGSVIVGSSTRRKFGTSTDFGSVSGLTPHFNVAEGDRISFVLQNNSGTGNLTIRNITITISRI